MWWEQRHGRSVVVREVVVWVVERFGYDNNGSSDGGYCGASENRVVRGDGVLGTVAGVLWWERWLCAW